MATLYYDVDANIQHKEVVGFIHDSKSAWADKANRVVIDPSVASWPLESANGLFRDLKKVRSIEGMQHINLQNVTNMSYMFSDCNSLTSVDLSAFNTENVTDMGGMFTGCKSLTSLNLASFSATGEKHPDLSGMFNDCSNLKTIYSHSFLWEAGCEGSGMFIGCNSLKGAVSFEPSRIEGDMATFEGYFTPAIKGDLDGDGKLSIGDMTRLVKWMNLHGKTYHYQADMDEDGKVTLDDLQLLEERIKKDPPPALP